MQKTLRQLMDDIAQIEAGYTKSRRLNSFNFYQGTYNEDSILDEAVSAPKWPTTKAEIEAFQRGDVTRLKVDGIIGQATMARLLQLGYVPPAGFKPAANKGAKVPGAAQDAPAAGTAEPAATAGNDKQIYTIPAGSWHDPEQLQAKYDNKFYRPATDWKDGTPLPGPDGEYRSAYSGKAANMAYMKIQPDTQWAANDWSKIFINYDNKPIISKDYNTWPRDPKHPFFHFVFASGTNANKRYDSLRSKIATILNKDSYGNTRLDYSQRSKTCPVSTQMSVPGFTQGNVQNVWSKLKFSEYGHTLLTGWVGPQGGAIMMSWTPLQFMPGENLNGALATAMQDVSEEDARLWGKFHDIGKVSKLSPISFDGPFGITHGGQQFVATKGKISWHFANGNGFISTKDAVGPHVDQITIYYFGPQSEWTKVGQSAMTALHTSMKLNPGVELLAKQQGKHIDEELAQIIKLARLT